MRFSILAFILIFGMSSQAMNPLHVVLDPGHGGQDAGATRGDINEADLVLKISRHLQSLLNKDPRFRVTMTRNSSDFIRLSQRAKKANDLNADLFLSIHANASPDRRAKGLEVYFQNQLPPDEESMYLASLEHEGHTEDDRYSDRDELQGLAIPKNSSSEMKNILKDLIRGHRIRESSHLSRKIVSHWSGSRKSRQHSILQAPFFVVSNVNMPSVLVEVGFVSNKTDAQKLSSTTHQKSLALSLYRSLVDFKESIDK